MEMSRINQLWIQMQTQNKKYLEADGLKISISTAVPPGISKSVIGVN